MGVAVITGCEGFVARYLWTHLEAAGYEVRGCDLSVSSPNDYACRLTCDITVCEQVEAMLKWAGKIDFVFHLAAVALPAEAQEDFVHAWRVNSLGTTCLINAMKKLRPKARLLAIGSSEAYGHPVSLPITESLALDPRNPYGVTKAGADHYCRVLHDPAHGPEIVRLRPFNHSGPGQPDCYVLSGFARQVAEAEAGLRKPVVTVGNVEVRRDFLHVQDVVRAYETAARKALPGEAYNICSGKARSLREVLDILRSLSTIEIDIQSDPSRMRPADVMELYGSHEKFSKQTGWQPIIPFDRLIEDLLVFWRNNFSI